MPDQADDDQLPLPGLGEQPAPGRAGALELAVRRTIAELDRLDMLTEADAATLQMMVELAQVITMKKASKRASTISNDFRLLWEIKDSFTQAEAGVNEKLEAAMREWAEATGTPVPEKSPP